MPSINKVVLGTQTLIDLTTDSVSPETLLKGKTAHSKTGALITGTLVPPPDDEVDRILTAGLTDGWKQMSDDGTMITSVDQKGRRLVKVFTNNFNTCTTTLYDANNNVLGQTVRTDNLSTNTITVTDSQGQTLTKTFDANLETVNAVLKASNGSVRATLDKTYSTDNYQVESVVSYGN